jgi:hypothetical protein
MIEAAANAILKASHNDLETPLHQWLDLNGFIAGFNAIHNTKKDGFEQLNLIASMQRIDSFYVSGLRS